MKYYLDITILPDAEASLGFIWHKVYHQIHIALADNKFDKNTSKVALSFPKYGNKVFPLGNTLRLLTEEKQLIEVMNVPKLLNRLTDYTHCKSIQLIDESKITKHVCFMRKQFKSNIVKKAQRRAKCLNKSFTEVLKFLKAENKSYQCNLPFINLISLSSKPKALLSEKDHYKLFIEMQDMEMELKGDFNCYGLSSRDKNNKITVPWF